MSLNIGRQGKIFVKLESSYGVDPTLAATNALRHVNLQLNYDPYQRVTSPEKKQSPGPVARFDRRTVAGIGSLEVIVRPSGTLNTLGETSPLLEALCGSKTNVTLDTTVASGASAGGCVLTSAVGLAKGDAISIVHDGVRYVRFLTDVTGSTVTWAPNLPEAPDVADVVKGCITYKLTTALAKSLWLSHYLPTFSRNIRGVGLNTGTLALDGTEEAKLTVAGPGQLQSTPAESEPAAFTTVGGNPPTGMVGELYIGNAAYLHKSLEIAITNNVLVRNVEAGTGGIGTEVYRSGRREITVQLEAFVETEATLYDLAEAGTETSLFRQNGRTEGNIFAVYMPRVEFKPGDTSDEDEATNWAFQGMALETADGENDELRIAFA